MRPMTWSVKLGSNFDCAVAPLVPFVPLEAILMMVGGKCLEKKKKNLKDLGYLGMGDDEGKDVWVRTWRSRR